MNALRPVRRQTSPNGVFGSVGVEVTEKAGVFGNDAGLAEKRTFENFHVLREFHKCRKAAFDQRVTYN